MNFDGWRGEVGKLFMVVLVTLLGELKSIRSPVITDLFESQKKRRI